MGDSNPHFNFSPHLGDTLTCSPVFAGGATRTHIIPLPTQPKTPATDGRTRLERVGWLSGRLPATDAHHLCFVPLLYHNLGGLSRGFFQIALKNIKSVSFNHAPVGEGVSPLDTNSIPQMGWFVNRQYCTIMGKFWY